MFWQLVEDGVCIIYCNIHHDTVVCLFFFYDIWRVWCMEKENTVHVYTTRLIVVCYGYFVWSFCSFVSCCISFSKIQFMYIWISTLSSWYHNPSLLKLNDNIDTWWILFRNNKSQNTLHFYKDKTSVDILSSRVHTLYSKSVKCMTLGWEYRLMWWLSQR